MNIYEVPICNRSISSVTTSQLLRNGHGHSESMTTSESIQNMIKVSSIHPSKLNNILNSKAGYARGPERRWSAALRHSIGRFECSDDEESEGCECGVDNINGMSMSMSMSDQLKNTQEQDFDCGSVLENDSRFHEVDGFFVIAPKANEGKLKSLINDRFSACKFFLDRINARRHSSDEVLSCTKLPEHKIFDTLPRWHRRSSLEVLADGINVYKSILQDLESKE
eukprot:CAMPEP_0172520378 /NCGR_PEP_ID=MMETSP1066-20121228/291965_1 /TAXON_ID=671091 /ORGANISM="Coscinodiscus wailesii, Strain CCMP2513" /LENGTH=223 /DNA_ID=CAMNT_0013303125 /DNA_START=66 /DNA_END=737 /DNA_ORIENTATION=+